MKNIWRLFLGDLKRAKSNTVTLIVLFGLVMIPSIFSWYNMIACWNVFDNTGNLKVAVVNEDGGYKSDLVPVQVNVGDRVVSALRANSQLNWVFTDYDDALDGAQSGRYYAALVIPESFSADMMTFYSPDAEHATIRYYSNEKKSAIAPKVTDQGADQISNQVNSVFVETLSEIGLGISSALLEYADDAGATGRILAMAQRMDGLASQMDEAASTLEMYAESLAAAQRLAADSNALLADAASSATDISKDARSAKKAAGSIADALTQSTAALAQAVEKATAGFEKAPEAVDGAFTTARELAGESAGQLEDRAETADALAAEYRDFAKQLESLEERLPANQRDSAAAAAARLKASAELHGQLAKTLRNAAEQVRQGSAGTEADRTEVEQLAQEASDALSATRADQRDRLEPALAELASTMQEAGNSLASVAPLLEDASAKATDSAGSLVSQLQEVQDNLGSSAQEMRASAQELRSLSDSLGAAANGGDLQAIREIIGSDPAKLAAALSSPVQLERHAVYPVENFGSAMSPLYTTLALWIGALLAMVTLKVLPSRRTIEELDHPTAQELFCGRFGIIAIICSLQSIVVALGNLFFLHVQAVEPLLYLLCFWVSGLVFAFIIYTMVASFGNLGKALGVLLLILQVTGGGGSFPLPLLPQFFQDISPYLPIAHVVNAMRAAMFGIYQADFWMEMGILLLFAIPFIILGLVVRNPLIKIVSRFVEKVEASKLM